MAGHEEDRASFVRRYAPVVTAYLKSRWKQPALHQEIADVAQEVFYECFRQDGALARVEPGRPGGFRAYFFGVVRNVARMTEARWRRDGAVEVAPEEELDGPDDGDDSPSRAFDRAWARALLREAAEAQEASARAGGGRALRRVEILKLRFNDGVPIREIAWRWNVDPAELHHEYARARKEYKEALRSVLAAQHSGSPESLAREWEQLESLLRD